MLGLGETLARRRGLLRAMKSLRGLERDQRGYVVVVTGVLYGTTHHSLHPVKSWTAVHCGPNLALLPTYVYRQPPLPPLSLSFSAPLPRRGHRSQFILPTPLPGARYSLRLAIPSSLCLSYHSARPELQCGYPPFTAQLSTQPPKTKNKSKSETTQNSVSQSVVSRGALCSARQRSTAAA